jgi:putative CocE/NonD family hydrolase
MHKPRSTNRSRLKAALWLGLGAATIALLVHRLRDHIPTRWIVPLQAVLAGVKVNHDVRIPMDDGVQLATSVYRPGGSAERLPTVLIRLPYDRRTYDEALTFASFLFRHGYAVVLQDVRGTYESGGTLAPWRGATADGVATLEWIRAQPWSNGKVGTFGCSALGELQYALARANHPAHAAMVPIAAGGAIGSAMNSHEYFGSFEGGIFELATSVGWFLQHGVTDPGAASARDADRTPDLRSLPVIDLVRRVRPGASAFEDYLRLPLADARWQSLDYVSPDDRLSVPALVINTWGDQTIAGTLAMAEMARRQPQPPGFEQHVVIAPGNHCEHWAVTRTGRFGDLTLKNTEQPYGEWYLKWFDQWLKGEGPGLRELPPYLYYVIGEDRWLTAQSWPPEQAQAQRWYLGSDGRANSRDGDGMLSTAAPAASGFDEYRYDPADPVPSRGGPVCCTGDPAIRSGPVDQHDVEVRPDVLVYTSAPLARPMRIAGTLTAHLTVSSDAPDTDFVARLVDVRPDGRATNIQEGALRARFRDGFEQPHLMQPGERYELEVNMRSIAYLLPAGHRLRLQVTSSSFPRLERNLNTGGRNFDETVGRVAVNRVHHGVATRSYVEIPVLDVPAVGGGE